MGVGFSVYIPARMASTRLPGKALVDLGGQSMLQRVHGRALESGADVVVVATDDERIADAARAFGAEVCMTAASHESGTERIAEACEQRGEPAERIIVNLQGDEPFMAPAVIRQVAECLARDAVADMATVCEPLRSLTDWLDPNVVKVVRDAGARALYFSRATIPFVRDGVSGWQADGPFRRHIGLYAYRAQFLKRFVAWPPAALELLERLEQLRGMANGASILVPDAVAPCGLGIDTPGDLARARQLLQGMGGE